MPRIVLDRIQVSHSATPGELPPQTLLDGELWVNSAEEKIWVGVTGGSPVPVGDVASSVVTATQDGLMSAADKVLFDQLIVDLASDIGDHADLRAKLAPILVNGWHSVAEASGAGGVPTLDSLGRIEPSMIGGTDMAPAFAGEVPKFKANGLVDTSLIDYDFRSIAEPSQGTTPTAADAGKLVRLTHLGKISSNFLEIDPLDHRGVLYVDFDAGYPYHPDAVDGAGQSGEIWMIKTHTADEYDLDLKTGVAVVAARNVPPPGQVRVKTGDLLVKDSALEGHIINGELMNDGHLLPRDGTRPMVGDLIFDPRPDGSRYSLTGVGAVAADEVGAMLLKGQDQAGTPGLGIAEIDGFVIDGAKNHILIRTGVDPAAGRAQARPNELFLKRDGALVELYQYNGASWDLIAAPSKLAGELAQLRQEFDALRQEFDALRADYATYKAAHP